jgi:hypothetical protein
MMEGQKKLRGSRVRPPFPMGTSLRVNSRSIKSQYHDDIFFKNNYGAYSRFEFQK